MAGLAGGLESEGPSSSPGGGGGPVRVVVAGVAADGSIRGCADFAGPLPGAGAAIPRLLGAGRLAFTVDQGADTDRYLYIHDVANGDVLFQTRLPASVQGFPITYAVEGRQYLAVPVGGNRSNAIYVFALPQEPGARR